MSRVGKLFLLASQDKRWQEIQLYSHICKAGEKKVRSELEPLGTVPDELLFFLFASRQRLNGPRGIELPRVISTDHFRFGCSGPTFTRTPFLGQQMSSGNPLSKIHTQRPPLGWKLWVWLH